VQHETVAPLLVSLTTLTPKGDANIPIALPEDAPVDVLVRPNSGFEIDGVKGGTLTVKDGESAPLFFKLRAVDVGAGEVDVLAFHRGAHLGTIALTSAIVPGAVTGGDAQRRGETRLATPPYEPADLTLMIEDRPVTGGTEFNIELSTKDGKFNVCPYGPVLMQADPHKYFADFFGDIESLPANDLELRLASRGAGLFTDLIPEPLRETLWSLRDSITSMVIQSEEGLIPWELCKLVGKENGSVVEGPFLCEAYAIARWVPGTAWCSTLTAENVALVVPSDSGLPSAPIERDFIRSLQSSRAVTEVPATYSSVHTEFMAGKYDVWHFTGHGIADHESPDRSAIVLQNEDSFTPQDLSGVVTNLGHSTPIVFLNACQSSVGGRSLTGVGGWAQRFVAAGAGAFVGTYWSVGDEAAAKFAETFYKTLLKGKNVATAVKEARLAIKGDGPTWLAYTVVADPLAKVAAAT
jgi:hypothetical protein